ncbi:MAG: hypothetical protein ACPGU7_06270 [Gammaproteobacteria bacterium]
MNTVSKLLSTGLCVTALAFSGSAAAFTIDGDLSDWLGGNSNNSSDWTPLGSISNIVWTEEDQTSAQQPNGGQYYDAEALYLAWDNTNLYYAVVTGLPETESTLPAGDIAFDFGDDGSWEYGIEVMDNQGNVKGGLYDVSSWDAPTHFPANGPWSIGSGTLMDTGSIVYENSTAVTGLGGKGGTHYVIEGSIALSNFSGHFGESFNVHWTMKCGNDLIELDPAITFPGTSTGVSAPATSLLFGLAMLGMIPGYRRLRRA